jgi:NADPH:quinone reductase-like Zn-dependent oxidoreductase
MSQSMRALILRKVPAAAGQSVYHDAIVQTVPVPEIGEGQVLVKVSAAAFNHRDVSIP